MISTPNCYSRRCKHLLGVIQPDGTEATERPYCTAFPDGIPAEISYGKNLHLAPFVGDNGIQYEREPGPVHNVEGLVDNWTAAQRAKALAERQAKARSKIKPLAGKTKSEIPKVILLDHVVKPSSKSQRKWEESLTPDQRQVMSDWTQGEWVNMKEAERKGAKKNTQLNEFHAMLDKAPKYKGTAYRGVDIDVKWKQGTTVEFKTSTSASQQPSVAYGFLGYAEKGNVCGSLLRIKSKTGVDITNVSAKPHEVEVVMRHKTRYKVIDSRLVEIRGSRVRLIDLQEF